MINLSYRTSCVVPQSTDKPFLKVLSVQWHNPYRSSRAHPSTILPDQTTFNHYLQSSEAPTAPPIFPSSHLHQLPSLYLLPSQLPYTTQLVGLTSAATPPRTRANAPPDHQAETAPVSPDGRLRSLRRPEAPPQQTIESREDRSIYPIRTPLRKRHK